MMIALELGSEFRSPDLLPQAASAVARNHANTVGETLGPGDVPETPAGAIAHIDGYENRTAILRAAGLRRDGCDHDAFVGNGTLAVLRGRMGFAPGSSC
ncbi:hypothetical protein ACW7BC_30025 [Azospirillum argentinense]|uniref:hypothetical protein n=1 Tax=Azospirillum argentinense TaxID=2970906 RepID=UPI00190C48FA|nr:hypothetical protein [Azospirillum argentinense]